jgi:hypothetical protein
MAAPHDRLLRITTLLTTALATPFLIALTVLSIETGYWYSHRDVTTFCFGYFPLAMTAIASAISIGHHRKHKRAPGARLAMLDGLALATYLGVLIPIWVVEIAALGGAGLGLLVGYLTAPMIVNMYVLFPSFSSSLCLGRLGMVANKNRLTHAYIFAHNARAIFSSFADPQVHECPNCHNNFTIGGAPKVQETTATSGERYSLLRGEDYLDADADAEAYNDASTRPSAETMRPDGDEGENKEGQGKTILDV